VHALLKLSRFIDGLNDRVGKLASWLILAAVLVSSGNAVIRSVWDKSSNGWLELQWVLFSAVFLLCSGYALLHHAHVRIDVVYLRWSRRTQLWIDIFGTVFFLLPMAILIMVLSWPTFVNAYMSQEVSANAGGLVILRGLLPDPALDNNPSAEEELAQAILSTREKPLTAITP